jgi:hypothetical protein
MGHVAGAASKLHPRCIRAPTVEHERLTHIVSAQQGMAAESAELFEPTRRFARSDAALSKSNERFPNLIERQNVSSDWLARSSMR